jgi:tetrapyrrole methylase family protein / MazG family protein
MTPSSPHITIVGLGPGDPELRTVGTQRTLDTAARIILRTRIHPGLDDLRDDPRVTDCDDLYERAAGFDQLYSAIADRVIDAARESGPVVFAVPGHPRFGEQSVTLVEARARDEGIAVSVHDAVSFIDSIANATAIDPLASDLQVIDAQRFAAVADAEPYAAGQLGIDPTRFVLVGQIYNRRLATEVKLGLARLYPEDHPIVLVIAAGVPEQERTRDAQLFELDRLDVDHLSSLLIPPLSPLNALRSSDGLARIVARLRAPGGCPWDREQTHASLRDAILEEAYETVDAIDANDVDGLAEELGDLLLLVAMHAQLAEEEGTFRLEDVYEGISRKLIRRHPHVFGEVEASTPEAVIVTWEGVKAAERQASGTPARGPHPLDALPRSMPALLKAVALLAPRKTLSGAADEGHGLPLLAAIKQLIGQGIDPERALERTLRQEFGEAPAVPAGTSTRERGEGVA